MSWLRALRRLLADALLRPRGLARAGSGCRVRWPHRLHGREAIHLGERVRVDSHAWIEGLRRYGEQAFQPRIEIGDDVAIGRHATITATESIRIGAGSLLSEGVYISDHGHAVEGRDPRPLVARPLRRPRPVSIGARCFLGFRACVLPGVTLGDGCVVGAHAVVTRSFPAGSVLAGCPARLLRPARDHDDQ